MKKVLIGFAIGAFLVIGSCVAGVAYLVTQCTDLGCNKIGSDHP